jgi:hypothetical protein
MRRLQPALLVSLLVLGVSGCGGTENRLRPTEAAVDAGASGAALDVSAEACDALIDAFEFRLVEPFEDADVQDSSTAIDPVTMQYVDPVGWWVSSDGTNPNHVPHIAGSAPCPADEPNCSEIQIPPDFRTTSGGAPRLVDGAGQCEPSAGYMKLKSSPPGFGDWGLTFGANMRGEVRNGEGWDGIAFWAKHAPGSDASTFYATLPDQYTSNQGGDMFCANGLLVKNLCDPFGRALGVTVEWRLYFLPFDAIYQQGFGKASPLGRVEIEDIIGLSFQLGGGTWEFALDEIVYYRSR